MRWGFLVTFAAHYCCKTANYYHEEEINPVRQVYQKKE
jgi:hypothetical protein